MIKPGTIIIKAPLKNSPAEKYGLKAGDIILEVDDNKI
jgi:C-terminal processing protease CtpA/Prc